MRYSLFLSLLLCLNLNGQIEILERTELPYEKDLDMVFFEPIGEKGIVQIATEEDKREDLLKCRIQYYDTNLTLYREEVFKVDFDGFVLSQEEVLDGKLHLTLADGGEYIRYVSFDLESGDTLTLNYKAQPKNKTLTWEYHDNKYYIIESGKRSVNLFVEDLLTRERTKRPINPIDVKPKDFLVRELLFPDGGNDLFFLVAVKISRMEFVNRLYHLHEDGIIDETFISNPKLPTIKNISILRLPGNDRFKLFGAYGNDGKTTGIFFGELDHSEFILSKRYNFLEDFDSINHLDGRLDKLLYKYEKKRAERRGETQELDALTTSHPIKRLNDGGYLWISEFYTPIYINIPMRGPNGMTTHQRSFQGYQTFSAIIARLDSNGEKLWDRSIRVLPYETPFYIKKYLIVNYGEDQINFIYQRARYVRDRAYNYDGKLLFQSSSESQLLSEDQEKAKNSSNMRIDSWYADRLVAYGYQKIKNKEDRSKSREVFSINKMVIKKSEKIN